MLKPELNREPSLDIYRGGVIFLMIIANATSKMANLPWWMDHSFNNASRINQIAWLDLISPMFMFIMGAAIPLAIASRMRRGQSRIRIVAHMIIRGGLLIWLGTAIYPYWFSASGVLSEANRHILGGWWYAFGWLMPSEPRILVGAWYLYGLLFPVALLGTGRLVRSEAGWHKMTGWALRVVALAYLVWATLVVRTGPAAAGFFTGGYIPKTGVFASYGDNSGVFPASILGYLGFAYVLVGLIWAIVKDASTLVKWSIPVLLLALMVHFQHEDAWLARLMGPTSWYLDVGTRFGYYGAMVAAGALVGDLFTRGISGSDIRRNLAGMMLLALSVSLLAGGSLGEFPPASIARTLVFVALSLMFFWMIWEISPLMAEGKCFGLLSRPATALGVNPLLAYMLGFGLAGAIDIFLNAGLARIMTIGHNLLRTTSGYVIIGPGAWWCEGWWGVALVALPYAVICTAITMLANKCKIIVKL